MIAAMPVAEPSAAMGISTPVFFATNASLSCGTNRAPNVSDPLITMLSPA